MYCPRPWALAFVAALGCASSTGGAAIEPRDAEPPTSGNDPTAVAPAPTAPAQPASTPTPPTRDPAVDAGSVRPDGAPGGDTRADLARDGGPGAPPAPPAPSGPLHALVAVGYGGVRALSTDDGATWMVTAESAPNGGDDMNLLRAVAYGNRLWVAGGWNRFFTSPDGRMWTERAHKMGIVQGMAYGNDMFLLSTIDGVIYRSADGLAWTRVGAATVGKHTELVYAPALGLFAAAGDNKVVATSKDGAQWAPLPGLSSVAYCGGPAFRNVSDCFQSGPGIWNDGVWVRGQWKGILYRSTDGAKWTRVMQYPANASIRSRSEP